MTDFDGVPIWAEGQAPGGDEIADRRAAFHAPYHAALQAQVDRVKARHGAAVVYDCHSIRSVIPRLLEGELPNFNIGTNSGASCDPALQARIEAICDATAFSRVSNWRFKGGYITRRCGAPEKGIHAVQMELACRGYMPEAPGPVNEAEWPTPFDPVYAAPMRAALKDSLTACLDFALSR